MKRTKAVSDDILLILDQCTVNGHRLTMPQMEASLYRRVNQVLELAGGTWSRKDKAHVFAGDPTAVIESILMTGSITPPEGYYRMQEYGCFFTSPTLAGRVVDACDVGKGHRLLEPNGGHGAIALAARARGAIVDTYELLPENVAVLKALDLGGEVTHADFLTVSPQPTFDRVCMNPPFLNGADVLHTVHAYRFLQPDGRLAAVMSAGFTYRKTSLATAFRELVEECRGRIEKLPDDAFRSAGLASLNTVLVTLPGGEHDLARAIFDKHAAAVMARLPGAPAPTAPAPQHAPTTPTTPATAETVGPPAKAVKQEKETLQMALDF